jgi:coenzyme F420-reducing hydrogenase delta subunit
VAKLLDEIGLGGERVSMQNISSAMGAQFAEIVNAMVTKLRELGPSPLRDSMSTTTQPNGGSNDCR